MMIKHLLLLLVLVSSYSIANPIENWKVTITDDYKNYSTTYVDGSEFGITCKTNCFYYLIQKHDCIKGTEDWTLIVNSIGDTLVVKNKCVEQSNVAFYIFDNFSEITNLLINDDIAQFINDINLRKKNQVTTYSIKGFKSVIDEHFNSQ